MAETVRPSAAVDEADLSGRVLGDYKLLRRLGRGAMAEVYLAEQRKLRRQVALKVLKIHLAGDVTYVARFQNEAMAAASLVHANIVQIYEVGQAEGLHYIAQEYVQGMNLREWLRRNGSPDAKLAVGVMRQTAAALHKAALAGIVHRDIKPENIMLSTSGELKVADFGLARITRDDDTLHLTQVGVTMGTPLYMSPEQVEGKPLDPRSDIYSFGVTCYHMLAGAPPFQGETALSVAVQHLKSEPRKLEEMRPDLPVALCRIVHRMMAKKPQDRYASAREMVRELRTLPIAQDGAGDDVSWSAELDQQSALEESVAAGLQSATRQLDTLMKTQAIVLRKRDRRWKPLAIAVLAAFLLGGAAAGVRAWREPRILRPLDAARVPRRDSAEAQLAAALWPGPDSEDRLKSVQFYFPEDKYHVARARQELARLYWRDNRLDEASALFDEFAGMLSEEYQAFGLAGQSLVYTKRGRFPEAAEAIGRLQLKNGWRLLDPRMAQDMQYSITANRQALVEKNALPAPPATPHNEIPRQASAEAQWNLARVQLDDQTREESLSSVVEYFPRDVEYVQQAKQELARLYLQQNRFKQAEPIFLEFATETNGEPADRAFGLAGRVILQVRQSDLPGASRTLKELTPLAELVDPVLAKSLAAAIGPLLEKFPQPQAETWREWQRRRKPEQQSE
ncbi:MAG: serine/threonine protein kinase [Planctomycetia bacterium]|nr:serine/threonine protein kinase [Planctomycetia bacterium]